MSTDGVLGAAWLPTDGYLDPSQLTFALAEGAREGGARIFTSTRVTGIDAQDGRVRRVRTERGDIEAEVVVIAAGMFSAEVGRLAGVRIPVQPMSHEFIVTQPFRERDPANPLPTLRDPDLLIYFREDGGGLVMGGYERPSAPAFLPDGEDGFERIPPDFNGRLLEDDWDRFEEIVVNSRRRVPEMENVKVTRMVNGPEGFTPDNEFCLGETEIGGLFVAAGFCAHGLAGAGGVGKVMAEWIAEGEPVARPLAHGHPPLRSAVPIALVLPASGSGRPTRPTTTSSTPRTSARPAGRCGCRPPTPGTASTAPRSARSRAGSESTGTRPNAAAGDERLRPRGWAGHNWSAAIGAEHTACREAVGGVRRELVRQARDRGPGRRRPARAPVRQPRGARRRPDHLHPDAQLARRDRVRLHRRAARRGALLDRHRHGVRQPRPRVDPPSPARRRLRARSRT